MTYLDASYRKIPVRGERSRHLLKDGLGVIFEKTHKRILTNPHEAYLPITQLLSHTDIQNVSFYRDQEDGIFRRMSR